MPNPERKLTLMRQKRTADGQLAIHRRWTPHTPATQNAQRRGAHGGNRMEPAKDPNVDVPTSQNRARVQTPRLKAGRRCRRRSLGCRMAGRYGAGARRVRCADPITPGHFAE
ncbi:hypothetical protein GCM10010269_72330 [Streptomyces humidus]|uniref:Uncharacterized protein n=1 Tax=Streptomyces humidus TaxID=52259 RepID=A0A918LA57_9ACTN|nr:hypothetical protein GCM10010269_72330 [Streptomyces humidus]